MKAEAHPSNRMRRRRVIFVATSVIALALGAFNKYHYYMRPSDECTWIETDAGVVIDEVVSGGAADRAGLESGDVLLRIAGENATTGDRTQAVLDRQRAGATIPYLVLREGSLLTFDVRIVEGGFPTIVLIMLIVGLMYWIIGFWIGWMRPLDVKARILFWMFLSFMLFWTLNNVPPLPRSLRLTILLLNTLAFTAIPAFFLYFFLLYPRRHRFLEGARWKKLIIFTPTFLFLIWLGVAAFMDRPSTINFVMGIGLWGVYFLTALFLLARSYRTTAQPYLRQQMRILFWGLFIGLLPAFALIVNTGFRLNHPMVIYSVPLMGLIPLVFAYTVVRHRLMDIEVIIKRGFVYSLLSGLILVFYILIVQILGRFLQDITGFAGTGILVLCTLFVALAFTPLRERILKTVDRAFYREAYDYRTTLRHFARRINRLIEPGILVEMVLKNLVETMHVEHASFFLTEGERCCCCAAYPEDRIKKTVSLPADSFFCSFIQQRRMPVRWADIPEPHQNDLELGDQPALVVPLVQETHFLGFILLGLKRSGAPYSAEDIELLATLADQVAVSYENGRLHRALTDQERMKHELEIARRIQMLSLPQQDPVIPGYDIFGVSIPATEVGGDYFDYFQLPKGNLGLVVGDVSGKGTSAALYMSKIQGFFRALGALYTSPKELLSRINALAFENMEDKSFITLTAAFLNPEEQTLTVARAGHTSVFHFRQDRSLCEEWSPPGIGLAMDRGDAFNRAMKEETRTIDRGDAFLFYSDGLTESTNEDREEFGEARLKQALCGLASSSAVAIGKSLLEAIQSFTGDRPQHDDMTLIVVKRIK